MIAGFEHVGTISIVYVVAPRTLRVVIVFTDGVLVHS